MTESIAHLAATPPRLVLMNGQGTAFGVYEGRHRIAEFVAPTGTVERGDIEHIRVQQHQPRAQK